MDTEIHQPGFFSRKYGTWIACAGCIVLVWLLESSCLPHSVAAWEKNRHHANSASYGYKKVLAVLIFSFASGVCTVLFRAEVLEGERKAVDAEKDKQLQELQHKLGLTNNNLKHQLTVQQSQVGALVINFSNTVSTFSPSLRILKKWHSCIMKWKVLNRLSRKQQQLIN